MIRAVSFFCSALTICLLIFSCKKNSDTDSVDMKKDYFPLEVGRYIVYNIDSTIYDEITHIPTTYKYQIKEKITQTFTDNENQTAYRLERYIKWYDSTKAYSQIPWQIKEVWMINAYATSIERQESNIRFVKLIFPPQQNTQWNGNAKNNLGYQTYTYSYVDNPTTISALYFEKTLKVMQNDFRTLINYQHAEEQYARNVGLIYKNYINVSSQTIIPNIPVENRAEKGVIFKMQIVSYGKE